MEHTDLVRKPTRGERSILALTDPEPPPELAQVWRMSAQASTIGIFAVMAIAALYFARPVLLPVTAAFIVTMMLGPLSARADRMGAPALLTALVLWALSLLFFYGLVFLIAVPAVDWVDKAPEISKNIQSKLLFMDGPFAALQQLRDTLLPESAKGNLGVDIVTFVQPVMSIVAPGIGQLLIFFGALFFMLLTRNRLRRTLVAFFEQRDAKLRALKIMNDIEHNLTRYLSVVTVINIGVGAAAGLIAWGTGMPDPLAWAVLGFILNYVPYLGAIIMVASLFLVAIVTFPTLGMALVPPLLFLVATTLEGHFLTPSVIGHKLTLNPLAVFLALVFWTWAWGPIGAFLSAPLLIIGMVAIAHLFPDPAPALPE